MVESGHFYLEGLKNAEFVICFREIVHLYRVVSPGSYQYSIGLLLVSIYTRTFLQYREKNRRKKLALKGISSFGSKRIQNW